MVCGTKRAGSLSIDKAAHAEKHKRLPQPPQQQQQQQQQPPIAIPADDEVLLPEPALQLRYLAAGDTVWQPRDAAVSLNVRLDGCIVPSLQGSARVSYSHVVVLDGFTDEAVRSQLLAFLTEPAATAEPSAGHAGRVHHFDGSSPGRAAEHGVSSGGTALHQDAGAAEHAPESVLQQTSDRDKNVAAVSDGATGAAEAWQESATDTVACTETQTQHAQGNVAAVAEARPEGMLPHSKWERQTADRADLPPTWGVKEHVLRQLGNGQIAAVQVTPK